MSSRFPDWQQRLTAYLHGIARLPLEYGRHDCALFAAGAVLAMTGVDFAADWRGRYTTRRGGLRIMRRSGYHDHVAFVRATFPPVAVAMALPGDLAVLDGADGPSLGVVQGPSVYVLHPAGHLGVMPLTEAVEAFRT